MSVLPGINLEVSCLNEETKQPTELEVESVPEEEAVVDGMDAVETETAEELAEKVRRLENENNELNQQYLRLRADLENIRRRTQVELASARQLAVEETIQRLLPVLDNFERALNLPSESDGWRKGVEMVARQFQEVLTKEGLEPIPAVGEVFDPEVHEAVIRESADAPQGTIIGEMQKGYKLNGKVIRPSMVKVAE